MAVTISNVKRTVFGDKRVVFADVTMDSSYNTAGEALSAADLGLKTILFADVAQKTVGTTIRLFQYDITNSKLLAFQQKDPAAAGGADIALPEVTAATNLSTITVGCMFIGN